MTPIAFATFTKTTLAATWTRASPIAAVWIRSYARPALQYTITATVRSPLSFNHVHFVLLRTSISIRRILMFVAANGPPYPLGSCTPSAAASTASNPSPIIQSTASGKTTATAASTTTTTKNTANTLSEKAMIGIKTGISLTLLLAGVTCMFA
jgi:hypothetical protein